MSLASPCASAEETLMDVVKKIVQSGFPTIPAIDSEFTTLTWETLVHRALTQPEVPLYAPLLERSETWPDAADRSETVESAGPVTSAQGAS